MSSRLASFIGKRQSWAMVDVRKKGAKVTNRLGRLVEVVHDENRAFKRTETMHRNDSGHRSRPGQVQRRKTQYGDRTMAKGRRDADYDKFSSWE
jgi:hypothetical protein